jgi:hypothetical protein
MTSVVQIPAASQSVPAPRMSPKTQWVGVALPGMLPAQGLRAQPVQASIADIDVSPC